MSDFMTADHLHDHVFHAGVQQDVSFFVPVGIHSQQIVQRVYVMHIDTKLTGDFQCISRAAASHNAVCFFINFLGANDHGTLTPFKLQVSILIIAKE